MFRIHITEKKIRIGELIDENLVISSAQDAVEMISDTGSDGCDRFIIYERNLHPDFFELRSGLAGDILQKFSNYRVRLAIIGDFSKFSSKSFQDFLRESNKHGHILFVENSEAALTGLNRQI